MPRFKVLAGIHVGRDPKGPLQPTDPETGKPLPGARRPPRNYQAGEIVEDNRDLVAMFGPGKFQYVGPAEGDHPAAQGHQKNPTPGDPQGINTLANTVFPGGQVSTGRQVTFTLPDGTVVSGILTEDAAGQLKVHADPNTGKQLKGPEKAQATNLGSRAAGTKQAQGQVKDKDPERSEAEAAAGRGSAATNRQSADNEAAEQGGEPGADEEGEGGGGGDDQDFSTEALQGMTKAELVGLADEYEFDVNRSANKDDLIKEIQRQARNR